MSNSVFGRIFSGDAGSRPKRETRETRGRREPIGEEAEKKGDGRGGEHKQVWPQLEE